MEKIYCCDRGDDNALTAAILSNNRQGDYNNWMNNPFAYLMFLAFTRNGGFGNDQAAQGQLDAIRTQMQDNQNSALIMDAIGNGFNRNDFALSQLAQNLNVDFNTLQRCCCEVQAAIQNVAGQVNFSAERVINSANLGDCRIIEALNNCCCTTQKLIQQQGYENRIATVEQTNTLQRGQDFINRSIERGFAASDYATQRQTCDIIQAGNANTQRIIDTLNTHWKDEQANQIQDLKFQLSQERQNRLLLSRLGGGDCNGGCGSCF